jgi:hypothetical protein
LDKIGAAYNGYRDAIMDVAASSQGLLTEGSTDEELLKMASVPIEEVFTPLAVAYLQTAYTDEFGVSSDGVVALPSGFGQRGEGFPLAEHVD